MGGCEQGAICRKQESVGDKPAEEMDRSRQASAEAAECRWLLRRERQDRAGKGAVCQGQEHPWQMIGELHFWAVWFCGHATSRSSGNLSRAKDDLYMSRCPCEFPDKK